MKKIKRTPQGTPIVPKDFHEWYEEIKDRWGRDSENSAYFALWKICQLGFGYGLEDALNRKLPAHSGSLTRWVSYHKSEAVESIINGYEVEEEPQWKIINDQNYCLTSIEAGYGNSLHWAFDSTKKRPILFDNEETAMYTAYITGGIVEKVEV